MSRRVSNVTPINKTKKVTHPNYNYLIYRDYYVALKKKAAQTNKVKKEPYYYINPVELNGGLLQYLCDNNKLSTVTKNGKDYLMISDYPVLLCEESNENRINDLSFSTIQELAAFKRDKHIIDFVEKKIFSVNGIDTKTNELVTIHQNVDYIVNISKLLQTNKLNCELDTELIQETLVLADGTLCNIVGFPTYNCRQMLKDPKLCKYLNSDLYRQYYSALESDYIDLFVQITGKTEIKTMIDLIKQDELKMVSSALEYKIIPTLGEQHSLLREIDKELSKLVNGLFTYPDIHISYQFYVFDAEYLPLIYNIHELENKHLPLLERIKDIIEITIPQKFNILNKGESRYENMFSYCKYGDLFSIKTEYIHPASNPAFYAHEYLRSITLEELIYTLTIPDKISYWQHIEYTYNVKNYRITVCTDIESSAPKKTNATSITPILSHPGVGKEFSVSGIKNKIKNTTDPHNINTPIKTKKNNTVSMLYKPPHKREGGLVSVRGKKFNNINTFTKKENGYIDKGDKIINIQERTLNKEQRIEKTYEIIIWKALDRVYYQIILRPCMRDINFSLLLEPSKQKILYYSCPDIGGKIYGLESDIPIYIIESYKKCSDVISIFVTNPNTWWFPSVKQAIPNYEFLDTLYKKYGYEPYSLYNSKLLQNYYNVPINKEEFFNIESNTYKCRDFTCSVEEMKQIGIYGYKHIIVDKKYKILVGKYKFGPNNFKYVCWIYKINNDNPKNIGPNMTINMTFIPGHDLLKILDVLINDKEMYVDPNGPNPKNMYINMISLEPTDMCHIQILPNSPNMSIHGSSQYTHKLSIQTESRAIPVYNIIPKLRLYPSYYSGMRKEKVKVLFSLLGLTNI